MSEKLLKVNVGPPVNHAAKELRILLNGEQAIDGSKAISFRSFGESVESLCDYARNALHKYNVEDSRSLSILIARKLAWDYGNIEIAIIPMEAYDLAYLFEDTSEVSTSGETFTLKDELEYAMEGFKHAAVSFIYVNELGVKTFRRALIEELGDDCYFIGKDVVNNTFKSFRYDRIERIWLNDCWKNLASVFQEFSIEPMIHKRGKQKFKVSSRSVEKYELTL